MTQYNSIIGTKLKSMRHPEMFMYKGKCTVMYVKDRTGGNFKNLMEIIKNSGLVIDGEVTDSQEAGKCIIADLLAKQRKWCKATTNIKDLNILTGKSVLKMAELFWLLHHEYKVDRKLITSKGNIMFYSFIQGKSSRGKDILR